jgi:hypothetical protein
MDVNLMKWMPVLTKKDLLNIAMTLRRRGTNLPSYKHGDLRYHLTLHRRKVVIDALREDISGYGITSARTTLCKLERLPPRSCCCSRSAL